jgi:hypothetical protein
MSSTITWENSSSFDDLLYMMQKFIKEEVNYYPGYYFDEDKERPNIDDADNKEYMKHLIDLNKMGLLTVSGQVYKNEKYVGCIRNESYDKHINGVLMQREYIDFYYKLDEKQSHEKFCEEISEKMKKLDMCFNICDYKNKKCYVNLADDNDVVTQLIDNDTCKIYPFTWCHINKKFDYYDKYKFFFHDLENELYINMFEEIVSNSVIKFAIFENSWAKKDKYLIERLKSCFNS